MKSFFVHSNSMEDIMDKIMDIQGDLTGDIKITDRKKISLTGIKKLVSFNPEEFLMQTTLGALVIKGSNLEVIKLDTMEGILAIKGKLNSLSYLDRDNKSKENSLWAKLFK